MRRKGSATELERRRRLAARAGLNVAIVSQIERGANTDARLSTVTALARARGRTPDDLGWDDEPPKGREKGRK